jgi:hypothetical protein
VGEHPAAPNRASPAPAPAACKNLFRVNLCPNSASIFVAALRRLRLDVIKANQLREAYTRSLAVSARPRKKHSFQLVTTDQRARRTRNQRRRRVRQRRLKE